MADIKASLRMRQESDMTDITTEDLLRVARSLNLKIVHINDNDKIFINDGSDGNRNWNPLTSELDFFKVMDVGIDKFGKDFLIELVKIKQHTKNANTATLKAYLSLLRW
jgi:hypothetical protein